MKTNEKCIWCGKETTNTNKRCNECWELEWRVRTNVTIAERILEEIYHENE